MPDLSHLWQRFVLATVLVFGLAVGVAATVFGYSNTGSVDLGFSVFHLRGVPLWSVALLPVAIVLAVGTVYHWYNSFHHFTQHMRHRHRVRELEAEVKSLRERLDQVLEMPDHSALAAPAPDVKVEPAPTSEAAPTPEPAASNGEEKLARRGAARKRVTLATEALQTAEPPEKPVAPADGEPQAEPSAEPPAAS